jgi:hypothetical protein
VDVAVRVEAILVEQLTASMPNMAEEAEEIMAAEVLFLGLVAVLAVADMLVELGVVIRRQVVPPLVNLLPLA